MKHAQTNKIKNMVSLNGESVTFDVHMKNTGMDNYDTEQITFSLTVHLIKNTNLYPHS